jgi:hypothetical protein
MKNSLGLLFDNIFRFSYRHYSEDFSRPSLANPVKRGSPFGKGSLGAIVERSVFTIMRLLIIAVEYEFFESRIFNFRS